MGGGLGVAAGYAFLYILTELLGVWYVASAAMAATLNLTINFIVQKFWTFENKDMGNVHRQAWLYLATGIANMMVNAGLLYVLVEHARLHYMLAQVILTFVLSITSYFVTCKIFAPKSPSSSS